MSYIKFESSRVKEAERREKRRAREAILKKAEADYIRKKEKDERARLRGDDKWILPSLEARIKAETNKEKKKKHKKKKKKSKRKKSSSSFSDTANESEEEDEWVEKVIGTSEPVADKTCETVTAGKSHLGPSQVENGPKSVVSQEKQEKSQVSSVRDEWMTLPGLFPCLSREQLREQSRHSHKTEEQQQKDRCILDRLGQSDRELNPYWRDGGTGLPPERKDAEQVSKEARTLPVKSAGHQGVDWLHQTLEHSKEQTAKEGRSVGEIAMEQKGTLEKLNRMLGEAEKRSRAPGSGKEYERNEQGNGRSGWRKDRCDTERTRSIVDGLNAKSSDDQKHSHRNKHGRSHTAYRSFQRPRTDEDFQHRQHDKQDGHSLGRSLYSEKSETFQKPKDEVDVSGRESPLRQDVSRQEVDGVSTLSSCRSPVVSENWRRKVSDNVVSSSNLKSSTCKETNACMKTLSSSSESEDEGKKTSEVPLVLTDKEMNDLGAKLIKAEILGNETLAKELKKKLDAARTALATKHREMKNTVAAAEEEEETVILTRTDSRGFVRPIQQFDQHVKPVGGRRRKQKMETHAEGKRVRYYADDDKYSLRDLFEREKLSTVEDENVMFSKLAAKGAGPNDHKYDMDDLFEEQAQLKVCDGKVKSRERGQAIREHKMIENCCWCFESKKMLKHLVVAIGSKVYLCVPPYQSLTVGHCLVVPMYHTPCATQLDEDVWSEIQTFRKTLTSMFREQLNLDVVFFETAMYLQKFPHMMMECVTLPQETGHLAPIYFKKAILECETEWTTNKKLVDLSGKDVRRAVPKGLPYFAVDFGLDSGFAHVIEDEKMFPKNFAQEIIGGMLDLDHSLWRKQRREEFDSQRKKALQFAEWWKMYDFTIRKEKDSLASEHIEA
ncbi:CWF19-like protein 2 [Cryptotermes secundus]|uniref:CWF19-like protein 2 n=1 Tax=Cryptotermes secundus TaxID=105785 RepID=A0A2J7QLD3_9NEOP|nr:CWF19-like protein 2 [Cryptotermes secundus]PNF29390.1 CWF19-like protein 2 [Cryptotermes secundus]PNF29391.1 CWF19-like protein 2 [Cryptotermes secundus]